MSHCQGQDFSSSYSPDGFTLEESEKTLWCRWSDLWSGSSRLQGFCSSAFILQGHHSFRMHTLLTQGLTLVAYHSHSFTVPYRKSYLSCSIIGHAEWVYCQSTHDDTQALTLSSMSIAELLLMKYQQVQLHSNKQYFEVTKVSTHSHASNHYRQHGLSSISIRGKSDNQYGSGTDIGPHLSIFS